MKQTLLCIFALLHSVFVNAQDSKNAQQHTRSSAYIRPSAPLTGTSVPLSGQYTIGGTTPDYTSISDACTALSTLGVSGPVEFIVRSGMYNEQVVLGPVTGTSYNNSVVFHSENNDSTTVTLAFPASSSSSANYTLYINGADYVSFSEITFQRTGTGDYSTIVELADGANNISFTNSVFIGAVAVTTSNTSGSKSCIYSGDLASNDSMLIVNNLFQGNANGIWSNGNSIGNYARGTTVYRNIFNNFYVGIFILYQESPLIISNTITRIITAGAFDYYGISIRYCTGPLLVTKNKITCHNGSYGLRLRECSGLFATPGIVANNFVQVGSTTGYGMTLEDGCSNQRICHNNVNYTSTNTTGKAMFIDGSGTTNINHFNNIYANAGGGYAIYVTVNGIGCFAASDNNCFYSTGSILSYYTSNMNTLANWQGVTGKDAHSKNINPNYYSSTDLHVNAVQLDNTGTPAGITDDIDGQSRSLITPDIGADEFTYSGINELELTESTVYPNPFGKQTLIVMVDADPSAEYIFRLYDINGRVVRNTVFKGSRMLFERQELSSGYYNYSIEEESKIKSTGKLIIAE